MFSIWKNGILNPLEILHIPQKFWPQEMENGKLDLMEIFIFCALLSPDV